MPCENTDNFPEYCELLSKIHAIVEDRGCTNSIVVGDFNADPRTPFGDELEDFCRENQYKYADKLLLPGSTYTFVSDAHGTTSWLDHCLVTDSVYNSISKMYVDYGISWTDHRPISIEMTINNLTRLEATNDHLTCTWSWKPRSANQICHYAEIVQRDMSALLNSGNYLHMYTPQHIDIAYRSVVKIMQNAASFVYKAKRAKTKRRTVLGWNDRVADHYAASKRALALWHRAGCPREGPIAEQRRQARANFKLALKKCQRNKEQITMNRIANDLNSKNFQSFWQKSNNVIKPKTPSPSHIDGVTNNYDIANNFNQLFTQPAPASTFAPTNSLQDDSSTDDTITVSPASLYKVVKNTVRGKSPGLDGLSIEHLQNAGPAMIVAVSHLFTAILRTAHLPIAMTDAVIVPICKNRQKNISSRSNYRPIALASIIARLLEKVLNELAAPYLSTADNQMGFKKNVSTSTAIYTLKQVAGYYKSRKTSVCACYLDLSKAFDRLAHDRLWLILQERGVPGHVTKVLKTWYSQQSNVVRWNGALSDPSKLACGVRQGGSMSPILFNVYMDGLSHKLNQLNVGCSMNGVITNHVCYADDMVLLSPSISAMRDMLAVCEEYAAQHNMAYNPDKSVCMMFRSTNTPAFIPPVRLNGRDLEFVEEVKYLGHVITADLDDRLDIARQRRAILVRANMLARRFARCSPEVKRQLFLSYCTSVYTVELWAVYTKKSMEQMRVQYNNSWRALFRLPRWCSASGMFAEGRAPGWAALRRLGTATARTHIAHSTNQLLEAARSWQSSPLHREWRLLHRPSSTVL